MSISHFECETNATKQNLQILRVVNDSGNELCSDRTIIFRPVPA